MNDLLKVGLGLAAMLPIAMGCGAPSLAGTYRLQQDGYGFGEGAEKTTLALQSDQSFEMKLGNLDLAKGTWRAEGNHVYLSNSTQGIGTEFHVLGGKLVPSIQGKDVTKWRFVRS